MANQYIWSGASGTANGSSWENARITLASGVSAAAAGDTVWVAHDHSESSASSITISSTNWTSAAPGKIISVNRAGSVPPTASDILKGATITTTGASAINLTVRGYVEGLIFNIGTGASTANFTAASSSQYALYMNNCDVNLLTTASGSAIIHGSGNQQMNKTTWLNCKVSFSNAGQYIGGTGQSDILFIGPFNTTLVQGATLPNTLISDSNAYVSRIRMRGVNLSNLENKKIVGTGAGILKFEYCKVHSTTTLAEQFSNLHLASPGSTFIGCSSTDTPIFNAKYSYQGRLFTNTTVYRTSGAVADSTPYSWQISANSPNNDTEQPFETFDVIIQNTSVGSPITATFHVVTDNITLTNRNLYVNAMALTDATASIMEQSWTRPATVLTTASDLDSDSSESWTTTGLTTPIKQKVAITVTPQMVGPIKLTLYFSHSTGTVYVCPKPDVV